MRRPSPKRRTFSKAPRLVAGIWPKSSAWLPRLRNPVRENASFLTRRRYVQRVRLVVALVLAVLMPAAGAGAVGRSVAPGEVTALAFDGAWVAYASGRSRGDCDRVRVWNLRTGRVAALGRTTSCVQTSTGTAIAAVSAAGPRVVWLHYTGGNIREWSLFTATVVSPRPRRLSFVARSADAPAPIVLGEGDSRAGGLLPYAVDRRVVVLRADGTRSFSWTAPERVTAVGVRGTVLAVALADGRIVAR